MLDLLPAVCMQHSLSSFPPLNPALQCTCSEMHIQVRSRLPKASVISTICFSSFPLPFPHSPHSVNSLCWILDGKLFIVEACPIFCFLESARCANNTVQRMNNDDICHKTDSRKERQLLGCPFVQILKLMARPATWNVQSSKKGKTG